MKDLIKKILSEYSREISEKWTDEELEKLASQFSTKNEFLKNHGGAYQTAKKRGNDFFDKITSHMVSGYKLNSEKKKLGKEGFVEKAKEIFGDKYNYDKVNYVDSHTRVTITCPTHGDFIMQPYVHLQNHGCKWCGVESRSEAARTGKEKFIKQAQKIHGNFYDYSKVEYVNRHTPVIISCPKHGEFEQAPGNHITQKQGCPICGVEKNTEKKRKSKEEFVRDADKLHKGKYTYDNVIYINALTPVSITCPIHGDFLQEPNSHLRKPYGQGCPRCRDSKGEIFVSEILQSLDIDFIPQKEFDDCTNQIQGRYCKKLKFDFYLPEFNTIIEFDGAGHFQPIRASVKGIEGQIRRDKIKNKYCKDNNIKLIRVPYTLSYDLILDYLMKALQSNRKFILLPKYPKKGWNSPTQ